MRRRLRLLPRPLLLFAPSVVLGLLGVLWLRFRPLEFERSAGPLSVLLAAAGLAAVLLGGAWLLERTLPSFRHAGRLLERVLRGLRLTLPLSVALALATAVSEELFFRGALLGLVGVWPQALLFGLLHPATRRGWSYTVFTFVAGLAFGYVTVWTGGLWAAMLAHFVINLQGFLEVRSRHLQRLPGPTRLPGPGAPPAAANPASSPPSGAVTAAATAAPATAAATATATNAATTTPIEADAASPGISGSARPPPREPPGP